MLREILANRAATLGQPGLLHAWVEPGIQGLHADITTGRTGTGAFAWGSRATRCGWCTR